MISDVGVTVIDQDSDMRGQKKHPHAEPYIGNQPSFREKELYDARKSYRIQKRMQDGRCKIFLKYKTCYLPSTGIFHFRICVDGNLFIDDAVIFAFMARVAYCD